MAGSLALQEAARSAGVLALEPVMAVEVTTPEEYLGEVLGDLSARRGRVLGMEARGAVRVVSARVPMANLFGYMEGLSSSASARLHAQAHGRPPVPAVESRAL